jgi:2-polyprenyl-3-methyl-5-hydroxy-6-metoxy-1,4-benzoquinol methylase
VTGRVALGAAVRKRLGAFERPAALALRRGFLDLRALSALLHDRWPARRILEVGCGDGTFASELLRRYADADYVGIDIGPEPGRLFDGDRDRARFSSVSTGALLAEGGEAFDLVLLVDVLHHVPVPGRAALVDDLRRLTRPGGHYVVKDWEPRPRTATAVAYFMDRVVSGTEVAFPTATEIRAVVAAGPGVDDRLVLETRVPPRRNNVLLAYERG